MKLEEEVTRRKIINKNPVSFEKEVEGYKVYRTMSGGSLYFLSKEDEVVFVTYLYGEGGYERLVCDSIEDYEKRL